MFSIHFNVKYVPMFITKYLCITLSLSDVGSKISILALEQLVRGLLWSLVDKNEKYPLRFYCKLQNSSIEDLPSNSAAN